MFSNYLIAKIDILRAQDSLRKNLEWKDVRMYDLMEKCVRVCRLLLLLCFHRQEDGGGVADDLDPTYFFNTAAQLLVSDSLKPVEAGVSRAARRIRQGRGGDNLSAPLPCRSR